MGNGKWQHLWRRHALPPLLVAIALIILLPLVLQQGLLDEVEHAAELVDHTNEVRASANGIAFGLRDLEAAVLALYAGIDTDAIRSRIAEDTTEVGERLDRLIALSRDNPEQQVRLGALRARAEQRLVLSREAIERIDEGRYEDAQGPIREMTTLFPVRELVKEIIAAETAQLGPRLADARAKRERLRTLGIVGAVVQLLLLASIAWALKRQIVRVIETEGALEEARSHAGAILQTVRDPIALVDREQRMVLHNLAFEELYGRADTGVALAEVGDGSWDDPAILQRLRDVVGRQRELWDHELRQRTADGAERVMLVNARSMRLPDRDEPLVLLTLADISAHKAAEDRIRILNRQLEGKVAQVSDVNRELEAFSYSVSHDLRAPLRHIAGFADKLGRHLGEGADEKTRHYVGVITDAARRMANLIDDLLVYSRLGRSALRLQPVDMQTLVDECRAMHDHDAQTAPIDWNIQPLPVVVADENMMRQVWMNLLGNAVKYSGHRERIAVEVRHERQSDGEHHFTVRDNGAGFDMRYAEKLFGVFQRLHKASDFPGTGIGLASVRRVLLRHGGRIWAESEPDLGASFHFTLPPRIDNPDGDPPR